MKQQELALMSESASNSNCKQTDELLDDKLLALTDSSIQKQFKTLKEINVIPLPDQITHPYCRCRIIKIRI